MRDQKLLWTLFFCLTLLNVVVAQAFAASTDNLLLSSVERSKDLHSFDEFPKFDSAEEPSSSKVESQTAKEQIKDSIRNDDENRLAPRTAGTVMFTTKQKADASKTSTDIVNETPLESRHLAPSNSHRPTVAIALGGGGVRGASHIGVLRVLREANIPIDYVVGNSMGAIVGGLFAAGVSLDDIEKIMEDKSLKEAYFPCSVAKKLLTKPLDKILHPFRKHYAGLWSGNKLSEFFETKFPKGVENVEDTPIPFSAVATNLIDGKAYRISNGKLSLAMRASSSIPPYLQPVAIDDKVFVDGGMRANLPASAARDTGADIVIAVLVDEPLRPVPAKRFRHLHSIAERIGDVMLAVADARQLPFADVIVNPDVSGLPVLNGDAEDARKAILAGEAAARKALPEIQRKLSLGSERAALSAKNTQDMLK